jgi:hypothetical protein
MSDSIKKTIFQGELSMKLTDTKIPITNEIDFSQRQITTNIKPKQKKLTAHWLLDENSKLFGQ